jgi:hypothetical protein
MNAVAALQAITIYMLLRLSEDDEDATDFDIPLIETMMVGSFQYTMGRPLTNMFCRN